MYSHQQRRVIPSLPDVVLHQIFKQLSYREQCRVEVVCRRWMNLIHSKFRRNVHELVVEQMGCHQIHAVTNIPLQRLTISCPFESQHFLSGVMRRHHAWLKKLTCDVTFLSNVGKLTLKKEKHKKFFTSVDALWIVMLSCTDEVLAEFSDIEDMLFLNLQQVTLQIHLLREPLKNAAEFLRLMQQRSPGLAVSIEVQAESSNLVTSQLALLNEIHLKSLKIICTNLDPAPLKLDEVSSVCEERKISFDLIGFREWYVHVDPQVPLARHRVETFRISSCTIANVDDLVEMIAHTQTQKQLYTIVDRFPKDKENAAKIEPRKPTVYCVGGFRFTKSRSSKLLTEAEEKESVKQAPTMTESVIPLARLEMAGHCIFTNFTFLNDKAQEEFDYRIKSRVANLQVDLEHLYFYQ